MTEEVITRGKHPGRVAQSHSLAALMKQEKNRYCVTKNSLQNSLQYSAQFSLQYRLQYSQMIFIPMTLVYLLSLT